MKAALYIRVSTEEQAKEGFSITTQKERLTAFCESQGWEIYDYYIEDGKSAKDMDRPELQRLLSDVENEKLDIVLVYRLDRLTRSVRDLYELLQTFEQHNVKFKSATEVYDTTTAMGRLFITLVAALAQWERENLAERVRVNMEQMVYEGKRPGAPIPYGYDKDENVIPEEKETLRLLRKLYMDGHGTNTVAKKLNQMGRLKRGVEWTTFTVYYVLDNPYYAGLIRWGSKKKNGKYPSKKKEELVDTITVPGSHEPIFTVEEYEEHKAEMKRRSFKGYNIKNHYWFKGVAKCHKCGSAMTGREKRTKRQDGSVYSVLYYICSRKQSGLTCPMPLIRQELAEKLIMEHIAEIKLDKKEIDKHTVEKMIEQDDLKKELDKLNKQLEEIKKRRKKWQYAFVEDLITADELRERNTEEEEKERIINERIEEIRKEMEPVMSSEEIKNLMFTLPEVWEVLDDKEKNELIRTIFKRIEFDAPEKVTPRKGKFIPARLAKIEYN
ncbi:Resolvase domain containing protein [Caldalkalibacillus thermarum TA2.A1]|uniref:Resolvase domain containing protein n=1 Tax=Caldalkalibacillus thermarum (strain TA2.A1) TaxID=986075 RepID=F5L9B8_CALTT|nr:recombinase family protein [Caldalkalibacillus thermarum]EGL82060.1 Resolvase domain containing protein [Caldalkalibacillus thermarum TA2.A1]